MSREWKIVAAAYIAGIALILTGQSIYGYTNRTIERLESIGAVFPQDEWYALGWWREAKISILGPVSIYLIIAGIVTLALLIAGIALILLRGK